MKEYLKVYDHFENNIQGFSDSLFLISLLLKRNKSASFKGSVNRFLGSR